MDDFETLVRSLDKLSPADGMTPINVLDLPDSLGRLVGKLIRRGSMNLPELAAELGVSEKQARKIGTLLTRKGFVYKDYSQGEGLVYRAYLARMRKRNIPLDL